MAIVFRSDSEVVNGTAGTSVTVAKPAGIVDTGANPARDHLIAFIAAAGDVTFTAPADWQLIGVAVAGTAVKVNAYRKLASSEPASWTWTLGSSVRNWGWVGAYTGVDPDNPITDSDSNTTTSAATVFTTDIVDLPRAEHRLIAAIAAVRAATGAATTWEAFQSERFDGSTNGGAGTDIAGSVTDGGTLQADTLTASQSQSSAATWALALNPYFTPYTGGLVAPIVEAAFGGDPDGDPDGWTWTDITGYVLENPGVTISKGKRDAAGRASPTEIRFGLRNLDGRFSSDDPTGPYWPDIRRNLPVRVSVPYGFTPPTERATAFVSSWRPRWDTSTKVAVVDVVASGRLRRLNRRRNLRSPMFRTLVGVSSSGFVPTAYWPMEDGSGATRAASAIADAPALQTVGGVSFAADSSLPGSGPLPTWPTGSKFTGRIPAYTATGRWCALHVLNIPTAVPTGVTLLQVHTTGTIKLWRVSLIPGSPDFLEIKAFTSAGTLVHTGTLLLSTPISETDFYNSWTLVSFGVQQDSADVDYELSIRVGTVGFGITDTIAGNTHGNATSVSLTILSGMDGASYGHLAVYTDSAFDIANDPFVLGQSMFGNDGEQPAVRFARLCQEEGIHVDPALGPISGEVTMGPQPVGTLVSVLQECEDAAAGLIHDGADVGALTMVGRRTRYNADVAITLDMSANELAPAFEPEFDDQRLVNDVTVNRSGGSAARVADTASIATDGIYTDELTINVELDTQLDEIAGWYAHLGTVDGMRYPRLGLNLRRTPGLTQQWLDCVIGSRAQAVNLMSTHPSDVDVFVDGYTEQISKTRWSATAVCVPATPYIVGVLNSDALGKLDTVASELVSAIDDNDTAFEVAVTDGPMWTVDDTEFPFDIRVGGEQATVTDIAPATITFGAAGTAAHAVNTSVTPGIPASVATGNLLLVLAAIRNSGAGVPDTPTGYTRLPIFEPASNVQLFGRIATSGAETAPTITFTGGVANADTSAQMIRLGGQWHDIDRAVAAAADLLSTAAQDIRYPRLQVDFPHCLVLYVGWKQDDWTSVASPGTEIGEPDTTTGDDHGIVWAYTIQTTPANIATGVFTVTGGVAAVGRAAVAALRCDKQTFTATRSVNGVVKAHAAGTAVSLWTPLTLAL